MEKLELKHLSPYLPYDLHVEVKCDEEVYKSTLVGFGYFDKELHALCGDKINNGLYRMNGEEYIKPILRPLSDITKEIKHNGERFVPMKWFESHINKLISFYLPINKDMDLEIDIETENYSQTIDLFDGYISVQKLLEWHFDVFGLIDKGLAIDINTI